MSNTYVTPSPSLPPPHPTPLAVTCRHMPSVTYRILGRPLFAGGHWVPGQILAAGGEYSGVAAGERSRVLPPEEICAQAPEVIFIAPCGYEQACNGILEPSSPLVRSIRYRPPLRAERCRSLRGTLPTQL